MTAVARAETLDRLLFNHPKEIWKTPCYEACDYLRLTSAESKSRRIITILLDAFEYGTYTVVCLIIANKYANLNKIGEPDYFTLPSL
jgi:hypothetical protein